MPKSDQTINNHSMELLDKRQNAKPDIVTYRFVAHDAVSEQRMKEDPSLESSRIHQIIPTVCASLSCIPFGLMLGWPSPTNPILLDQHSPIPISLDQSAMIAGFLMIGNAVGTPISRKGYVGSKFGILIGIAIMFIGWVLMWQSRSIYWLLGSRFSVGLGNAYSTGQLKIYISNTCDDDLKGNLIKLTNINVYLGIVIIFAFAPFISFKETSITCMLISIIFFFILIFLPASPLELVKADKINKARQLISRLKPSADVNNEIHKISERIKNKQVEYNLIKLFKQPTLRTNFIVFAILVFCQQFSGAPSTIIYTQILFQESHCPNAQYLAIAYVIVFLLSNILGIFVMPKFNKKCVLLCSAFSVIIFIVAEILVIYFEVNDNYWSYSSFVIMVLFIISHTLGLGNIPITLISDLFPSSYYTTVTHFFIAFHSILALIITKIFQVLMSQYNVAIPFYLFLSISIFASLFICFALPRTDRNENDSSENIEKCEINSKTIN